MNVLKKTLKRPLFIEPTGNKDFQKEFFGTLLRLSKCSGKPKLY